MSIDELRQILRGMIDLLDGMDPESMYNESVQIRVRDFEARADALFFTITAANPTYITCDMPHNSHSFIRDHKTKRCSNCNFIYCSDHALLNCVSCGHVL